MVENYGNTWYEQNVNVVHSVPDQVDARVVGIMTICTFHGKRYNENGTEECKHFKQGKNICFHYRDGYGGHCDCTAP